MLYQIPPRPFHQGHEKPREEPGVWRKALDADAYAGSAARFRTDASRRTRFDAASACSLTIFATGFGTDPLDAKNSAAR